MWTHNRKHAKRPPSEDTLNQPTHSRRKHAKRPPSEDVPNPPAPIGE